MTGGPADLVVDNLHKAFGAQPVLAGVDLTVPEGAFAAVLGPSGSGKTTLLRILAGFDRPDRGSVTVGGVTVDDDRRHMPADRRGIGYVSQEGSLFPHLDVKANVAFGLTRDQRRGPRVGELLDAVGLSGLGSRFPHELSGGQQQRVALARALAIRPKIVLLDEPFASLDANLRASVRADVHRALREAGTTAVLVTHDQDEALSIADLVAVIRGGKIAQVASPLDLYTRPVDSDLAHFVGDANLIPGVAADGSVETFLGTLALGRAQDAPLRGPVTVLIRPEQVEVTSGREQGRLSGRLLSTDFRGHDAIVRIGVDAGDGVQPIVARVLGGLATAIGSTISLSVRGPVHAWPISG
jgi:iron(III) transport system ATP-binding protein